MSLKQESQNLAFGGTLTKYLIPSSSSLGGVSAKFNLYLPSSASPTTPVPVVYYLAGLTCTEDTGPQKGGLLKEAGERGLAVVFPDTSPRGAGIEGEDDDWDFGSGAGFYLTATNDKFKKHYDMYTHIVEEIPGLLEKEHLGVDGSKASIMGHSMGGHGALSLYLKNPGKYQSASGLAPICNPTQCPWGQKAFSGYLTPSSTTLGAEYDSLLLLSSYPKEKPLNLLIDYGTGDKFYKDGQLRPEAFEAELAKIGRKGGVAVGRREGYDHSYFFVSTFVPDHIAFHAKHLKA